MNDLATTNNTNTLTKPTSNFFENDMTGLGNLRMGSPGNLILVQNTTRDPMGARPGQYVNTKTGKAYDELTLVPLHHTYTRVMFPAELGGDPICRSDDGNYPSRNVQTPMASNCGSCRFSKFIGGQKAKCPLRHRMMVIEKDGVIPMYLTISGTGFSKCEVMLDRVRESIVEEYASSGQRFELFDFAFTMTSERVANDRGVFYNPRFTKIERLEHNAYRGLFDTYVVNGIMKSRFEESSDRAVSNVIPADTLGQSPAATVVNLTPSPSVSI